MMGGPEEHIFEQRYQRFAWLVLLFNVLVILWGAYVRATGSGAGCGGNWPLCYGDVVPLSPTAETLIEYTHRITSGIALVMTLGLVYFSRRYPRGWKVRKAALASGIFIIIEALLGAGLVLFDLVGGNTSVTRAIASAVHLSNTYLLLAAITLTAIWAHTDRNTYQAVGSLRMALILIAIVGMIVIGATGAVTALGDTLFPAENLSEGLAQKFDPASHFLVRLRVIHPILSIIVGAFIFFGARLQWFIGDPSSPNRHASRLIALIVIQWVAGAVNVLLLAPIWMQMLHLLVADLIWIAFIVYLERGLYVSSSVITTR
jgi:heme A synthase